MAVPGKKPNSPANNGSNAADNHKEHAVVHTICMHMQAKKLSRSLLVRVKLFYVENQCRMRGAIGGCPQISAKKPPDSKNFVYSNSNFQKLFACAGLYDDFFLQLSE